MPGFVNKHLEERKDLDYKKHYIGDFNQDRDDIKSSCSGFCLDWIRRIKTGKFKAGESVFLHNYNFGAKQRTRLRKVADTHGIYQTVRSQIWNEITTFERDLRFVEIAQKRHKVDLSRSHKTDWKDVLFQATKDAKIYDEIEGEIDLDLWAVNTQMELMKKYRASMATSVHKQFQKDWEEKILITKTREVPQQVKNPITGAVYTLPIKKKETYQEKRTDNFNGIQFKDIDFFNTDPMKEFFNGSMLFQKFLGDHIKKLQPNEAAILSWKGLNKIGHDVAFFFDGASYYFLEPNFGEFLFAPGEIDSDLKNIFIEIFNNFYQKKIYMCEWICFA